MNKETEQPSEWGRGYTAGQKYQKAALVRQLREMSGQAFAAGNDEHAKWFRSLANTFLAQE